MKLRKKWIVWVALIALFSGNILDGALSSAYNYMGKTLSETSQDLETAYRIMPLGDSITYGYCAGDKTSTGYGGYRNRLCELIEENGYSKYINFVGTNKKPGTGYDTDNSGFNGYTIDDCTEEESNTGEAMKGLQPIIEDMMDQQKPHAVLLQIGTNDILRQIDLNNIGNRLNILADSILNKMDSTGTLFLATIPYLNTSFSSFGLDKFSQEVMDGYVDNYNEEIRNIVATKQKDGKNIQLVEINQIVDKTEVYDGVHPNAYGYKKMGELWYQTIINYMTENDLFERYSPVPTIVPTSTPYVDSTRKPVNSVTDSITGLSVSKNNVIIAAGKSKKIGYKIKSSKKVAASKVLSIRSNKKTAAASLGNGKIKISIPRNAVKGSVTKVKLTAGKHNAVIKVTVQNKVKKISTPKKVIIHKGKLKNIKVSVKTQNNRKKTSDFMRVLTKRSLVKVSSKKIKRGKAIIYLKGLRKGSDFVTVRIGDRKQSIKVRIR